MLKLLPDTERRPAGGSLKNALRTAVLILLAAVFVPTAAAGEKQGPVLDYGVEVSGKYPEAKAYLKLQLQAPNERLEIVVEMRDR